MRSSLPCSVRRIGCGRWLLATASEPEDPRFRRDLLRLLKQKYGIDFINSSKESVQWIRNGNYSPSKLYSEGMIPGLPFNLEDFDFLQVFFPEEA